MAQHPSLRVARATRQDLPGLADLMAQAPLGRRYGLTRAAATAALERAFAASDLLLLARAPMEGQAVGLAWVIATRAFAGAAYLRLLLVDEAHHGRGIGGWLLERSEEEARAWANHLYLLATTDNAPARRFYERRGYRYVGDLPELARPGVDEALYHKPLRPHGQRLAP